MSKKDEVIDKGPEIQEKLSYDQLLMLLLKTVKSLGINIDIVVLDVILTLKGTLEEKGRSMTLDDIERIAQGVVGKYQQAQPGPHQ